MKEIDLLELSPAAGPLRVDRERGILFGVKLLGPESRNGYYYGKDMRGRHLNLFENARCNLNHPDRKNPGADRLVQDRFGLYRNAENRDDGTYADLHYNVRHPFAESVAWFAENQPESLAFSINARGKGDRKDDRGRIIIESFAVLRSIDLVCDGGTTTSLFESERNMAEAEPETPDTTAPQVAEAPPVPSLEAACQTMQHAIMNGPGSDEEKMALLKEFMKFKKKALGTDEEEEEEAPEEEEAQESARPGPGAQARLRRDAKEKDLERKIQLLETEKHVRNLCRKHRVDDADELVSSLVLMESDGKREAHLRWLRSNLKPSGGHPAQGAPKPRSQPRLEALESPEGRDRQRDKTLSFLRGE